MKNLIGIFKNEKNFEDIYFVLKARVLKAYNPIFTLLFVDEENLICTDSKRLHLFTKTKEELIQLKNGLYEVIECNTSKIILSLCEDQNQKFPNWKQVIPEKTLTKASQNIIWNPTLGISKAITILLRAINETNYININYLKDILQPITKSNAQEFEIFLPKEKYKPILFTSKQRKAVLMPIVIGTEQN